VTCRGLNGAGGEGGAIGTEISGAGNGMSGGRVGNGKVADGDGDEKVAGAGVSSGKSGVAVGTEVGVGGRMGGRLVGWSWSMGCLSWG